MSEVNTESRSSVKVTTTAKGEALVEVKAYSNDTDLDTVRDAAVKAFLETRQALADSGNVVLA